MQRSYQNIRDYTQAQVALILPTLNEEETPYLVLFGEVDRKYLHLNHTNPISPQDAQDISVSILEQLEPAFRPGGLQPDWINFRSPLQAYQIPGQRRLYNLTIGFPKERKMGFLEFDITRTITEEQPPLKWISCLPVDNGEKTRRLIQQLVPITSSLRNAVQIENSPDYTPIIEQKAWRNAGFLLCPFSQLSH